MTRDESKSSAHPDARDAREEKLATGTGREAHESNVDDCTHDDNTTMNDTTKTDAEAIERVPDELRAEHLTVKCLVAEYDEELCDGWTDSVEIDPSDVRVDGYDRLHFADHVPTECAECGDRVLAFNGVEVSFHV